MFAKLKQTRRGFGRGLPVRLVVPVMVLALGITSVTSFVAPVKTRAAAYPDYSILNCAQERKPLLTISTNIRHRCVWALQAFLKYFKGYNLRYYDGIFGNETALFAGAYQQSKGLTVDGEVGNKTWGKIQIDCLNADIVYNDTYRTLVCNQSH